MANVDQTKIHQGPGNLWLGCAVPETGARLVIDTGGNPVAPALSPPAAANLTSIAGGSLSAATIYVVLTYTNPLGETLPSTEASLSLSANTLLVVASPAPSGNTTGYNVYAGSASGAERLQTSSPIPLGQNWTEPLSGLLSVGVVPPAAASAGPVFAGAVSGATTIAWTPKIDTLSADQVTASIDVRMTAEEQSIEAEVMETDYARLRAYLTNCIYGTGTDPSLPAGYQTYEELSFGGLMPVPKFSVAVISPRTDAPGKFVVSQLYIAYQAQAVNMPFSREKPTTVKVKFNGLAIPERPVGDQVGKIYRQP